MVGSVVRATADGTTDAGRGRGRGQRVDNVDRQEAGPSVITSSHQHENNQLHR